MTNQEAIKILKPLFEQCKGKNECLGYIEHFFTKHEEEALDVAIKALEQRWIPVSERLPEEYGMYLVTKATRKTELEKGYKSHVSLCVESYTRNSHWGKSTCGNVAWMPLPEPYKAESEEV